MTDYKETEALLKQFRTSPSKSLLSKLKLKILRFDFSEIDDSTKKMLLLARETLELAVLFSIQNKDLDSFERHIAQLKPYYYDYSSLLPASEKQWSILGLDLVGLLAENRIAEFHTCLELIAPADRDNTYIAFAVEVEQRLMEGSYNKVLMARKQVPDVTYSFFMDTLGETVRDRISECSEVAYETFPLHKAQDLLMMDSQAQLQEYMAKRGWQVQGDSIVFSKDNEKDLDLASLPMLKQQLGYAQELERII